MTSVKNMSRRQQKAVFANLGKGSTTSSTSVNREKLMSENLKPKRKKYLDSTDLQKYKTWQKESPNFITPTLVKAKASKGKIIELSKGTDFEHRPMFGVSVIEENKGSFRTTSDRGKSFVAPNAKEKAQNYYNSL